MQNSYTKSKTLEQIILRMDKNATSFLYFILESNEGISFYSTMPFEKGQKYRDVVIYNTPELSQDLKNILDHLSKKISFEVINQTH